MTICTRERECVLEDPAVRGIVTDVWRALPERFSAIALDAFVVMPNHVHLIVWLHPSDAGQKPGATLAGDDVGATLAVAPLAVAPLAVTPNWVIPEATKAKHNPTLGDVIGAFKLLVFAVYLDWIERHDPARRAKFWQHNYYEHIIRNERELKAIRQYIADNPDRWAQDTYNPAAAGPDPRAVDLWRLLQEGAG